MNKKTADALWEWVNDVRYLMDTPRNPKSIETEQTSRDMLCLALANEQEAAR